MAQLLQFRDTRGPVSPARIETVRRKAATPAYSHPLAPDLVDVQAWNHVGDPITESLIGYLRQHKLMGGDVLATARRLRAAGVEEAEAFFTDVEWTPDWVDFEAMRPGAAMGARCAVGLALGTHGALPLTYVDPATARVMNSTGRMVRLGGDLRRRIWETAAGFVGALDVDGMRPGGAKWEQWVRIRLLHTSIRMGILRAGRWDTSTGMPIGQPPTAAGAHIFGRYRVNINRYVGGRVNDEEAASFDLMWRWIARLQGANVELLGRDDSEQFRLACRIGEALYAPNAESRAVTAAWIDGLATMKSMFPMSRRAHSGVVRALLAPELTEILPGRDTAAALGLAPERRTDLLAAAVIKVGRGLSHLLDALPATPDLDRAMTQRIVNRGLHHRAPTFRPSPVAGDRG
ncbi:MAG: DUF2236 domain-containing protein [Nocardia sp.]|nr:DUF2236 domain-containing protein [Nocardia sp.]